MKLKEDQVEKIAIKVLNDLEWPFNTNEGASPAFHTLEEQYEKYKTFEGFEENKYKIFAFWTVLFDFPEDDNWQGRNVMFVRIKDDTGEPYEVGHRQWKGKVMKNSEGKFYKENY